MSSLSANGLNTLLAAHTPPCVSLYQPTPRAYPDRQQGPIRYRNLLRQAEEQLKKQHGNGTVKTILEKATRLADGAGFHGNPGYFQTVYQKQLAVTPADV